MVDRRLILGTCGAVAAAAMSAAVPAAAQQPEQVWEASGFEAPESAVYDVERDVIYVSNVAGEPNEKDGKGYISKLSPAGEIQEAEWASGLNAPKGMALANGLLYVADIDTVVAISPDDGKIQDSWTVQDAKFLNDVTADDLGQVFVSDMMDAAIYMIANNEIGPYVRGGEITAPNGLLATGDGLVVASWGVLKEPGGFDVETAGHLKIVDYADKTVQALGSGEPVGNLDGVEALGDGSYLVTDWVAGALFRIAADGTAEQLLDLDQGSADLEYIADQKLAVVPMMMNGTVRAYRIQ